MLGDVGAPVNGRDVPNGVVTGSRFVAAVSHQEQTFLARAAGNPLTIFRRRRPLYGCLDAARAGQPNRSRASLRKVRGSLLLQESQGVATAPLHPVADRHHAVWLARLGGSHADPRAFSRRVRRPLAASWLRRPCRRPCCCARDRGGRPDLRSIGVAGLCGVRQHRLAVAGPDRPQEAASDRRRAGQGQEPVLRLSGGAGHAAAALGPAARAKRQAGGGVLWFGTEEDPAEEIKPRVEAAGADIAPHPGAAPGLADRGRDRRA